MMKYDDIGIIFKTFGDLIKFQGHTDNCISNSRYHHNELIILMINFDEIMHKQKLFSQLLQVISHTYCIILTWYRVCRSYQKKSPKKCIITCDY